MIAPDQSTRLREWLRKVDLSQQALADRLDPPVDRTTVNAYVAGRRGVPAGFWQALRAIEQDLDG